MKLMYTHCIVFGKNGKVGRKKKKKSLKFQQGNCY